MIWFSSDLHLGHNKEFIWKDRGFNSVQEMNETYINNWNKLINDEDDVYLLGDICLGDKSNIEYVKLLKGKIHLIRGNHDTDARIEIYKTLPNFVEILDAKYIKYNKHHFYLTHYPCLTGNLEKESLTQMTCNLYGHTHQKTKFYQEMPFMYNVGVDSHSGYPILLDDIIKEMHEKVEDCKNYLDIIN